MRYRLMVTATWKDGKYYPSGSIIEYDGAVPSNLVQYLVPLEEPATIEETKAPLEDPAIIEETKTPLEAKAVKKRNQTDINIIEGDNQ